MESLRFAFGGQEPSTTFVEYNEDTGDEPEYHMANILSRHLTDGELARITVSGEQRLWVVGGVISSLPTEASRIHNYGILITPRVLPWLGAV
jgi:hypothetical protein